jgi:hypothetical protein
MAMLALLSLFSCKKDNATVPQFSAAGYWEGNFLVPAPVVTVILNKSNGSSRFYGLSTGNPDTALAPLKFDGTYTVNGEIFHANYTDTSGNTIRLETSRTTLNSMSGVLVLFIKLGNIETANSFEVIKQP